MVDPAPPRPGAAGPLARPRRRRPGAAVASQPRRWLSRVLHQQRPAGGGHCSCRSSGRVSSISVAASASTRPRPALRRPGPGPGADGPRPGRGTNDPTSQCSNYEKCMLAVIGPKARNVTLAGCYGLRRPGARARLPGPRPRRHKRRNATITKCMLAVVSPKARKRYDSQATVVRLTMRRRSSAVPISDELSASQERSLEYVPSLRYMVLMLLIFCIMFFIIYAGIFSSIGKKRSMIGQKTRTEISN